MRRKGAVVGCFLAYSVAVISGLRCSGEDKRGIEKFLLESGITGVLSLCCRCLESILSLMRPFCEDLLPSISLVWLPHSLLSVSRKPTGSFVLLSAGFQCCVRGNSY